MNAKGDLIARLVTLGRPGPVFEVETYGPAHDRRFRAQVVVEGQILGHGEGRSKKDAERLAAEEALSALGGLRIPAQEPAAPAPIQPAEVTDGPWPIYAAVLAQALDAALELAAEEATLDEVRAGAARLYRDLLRDLGHGPVQP
ncbi:putative dsRNA-binding protein [Deinococcus navajonensis]|uniref:DsRNA-binding protein n=1 Tax=Deinococcus navajonensis TaxID=309884 RepID=A0ABV8XQJ8_9DEIO